MRGGEVDVKHAMLLGGDGSVLSASSMPLQLPWTYMVFDTRAEHLEMMSDTQVLQAVELFLKGQLVGPIHRPQP